MKIYFFCGVIIFKLVNGKDTYQIEKIYFPDKIGVNSKTLMGMLDYYIRQKEMINNLTKSKTHYIIDIFRTEENLLNMLLNMGYSRSHIADIIKRGYNTLSKLTKYGI